MELGLESSRPFSFFSSYCFIDHKSPLFLSSLNHTLSMLKLQWIPSRIRHGQFNAQENGRLW